MRSIQLAEEAGVGESRGLVIQLEGVGITKVVFGLFQVALSQVEARLVSEHLSIALVDLYLLLEILLGLDRVILEEFFFKGKARATLRGRLPNMLLNDVVTLSLSLVSWNSNVLMELVLLALNHLANGASHLLDQENVQLGVEPILVILMKALDGALLSEVLLHNPHNRLLHALLEDVILS